MLSDWLKTQKKPKKTIRLEVFLYSNILAEILRWDAEENGQGFQQTTSWFCEWNNDWRAKKFFQKPKHSKEYVFLAECMGDVVQTEKYCQQNRGKRARKTEQATWNILRWSKKNKNGDDYEPDSLRVMIAALDRHLNEKGYKFSIIRDGEFHSSKQVLEGKAWQLR